MKFRKRAVVIEAWQFEGNNTDAHERQMTRIVKWINRGKPEPVAWHNNTDIFIKTLEGTMRATVGDWIIQGVAGEFYPCKDEIFHQTYEPAE